MSTGRINVLVYSGTGASQNALQHTLAVLRSLLQPRYAVLPLLTATLLNEPWQATCAALVFPGGGDLGYCRALNGAGNRKIRSYVSTGGIYLGFCAGGYYGCNKCEFEVDREGMEVVGDRELAFFPGICRGSVFGGFEYGTDNGTKAARLSVNRSAFENPAALPDSFRSYFNGGGVFVDAEKLKDKGVEVLAGYHGEMEVDGGAGQAAVVQCKVGDGAALLTGPHPEFPASRLSKHAKGMDPAVVDGLAEDETPRDRFLGACLARLGLHVNQSEPETLRLTPIHLSSSKPGTVQSILQAWRQKSTDKNEDNGILIKDELDTFEIHSFPQKQSIASLTDDLTGLSVSDDANPVKHIIAHEHNPPTSTSTPSFDHDTYFTWLKDSHVPPRPGFTPTPFGDPLMYGEVVTSTSTLLERNAALLSALPAGTTLLATRQLSGRGRGSNIWLSPPGSLLFSSVFTHPLALNAAAPLTFVQYLAALAVIEGIRAYADDGSYAPVAKLVRLKWPNDIYALRPSHVPPAASTSDRDRNAFVKIGGVLVNTTYAGADFTVVLGIGLNVSNAAPTTGLDALVDAWNGAADGEKLAHFAPERLLARILGAFATLYEHFKAGGFAGDIERLYYTHWLHGGQVVTLETEGGVRARVVGVTTDWGFLLAESVDAPSQRFALQADGNSFDFFRGLVKRKI